MNYWWNCTYLHCNSCEAETTSRAFMHHICTETMTRLALSSSLILSSMTLVFSCTSICFAPLVGGRSRLHPPEAPQPPPPPPPLRRSGYCCPPCRLRCSLNRPSRTNSSHISLTARNHPRSTLICSRDCGLRTLGTPTTFRGFNR